jgi:acylphosphatase
MGVNGWVRNQLDGTVEIIAEGDETAMIGFLDYLRRGPSGARVKSVDVEWSSPQSDLDPFEIR